jgi:hypothetical protein
VKKNAKAMATLDLPSGDRALLQGRLVAGKGDLFKMHLVDNRNPSDKRRAVLSVYDRASTMAGKHLRSPT